MIEPQPVASAPPLPPATARPEDASLDGLPPPRRHVAVASLSAGIALVVLDGAIATVALPTIARQLAVSGSEAVLIVSVYQLVLVMTLLPFSALGDRIGHRTLYQYGQIVFTVATALCFFARSLPFLLVVRAVQALGAAAALSVSTAMIRSIYPASRLGRGLGFNSVIVSSAAALAPTAGGVILGLAPWPWVFAAAVPFALLSLSLSRALPDPEPRAEPFDVLGAVLSAATFGLVMAGLESGVHGSSPVISAAIVLTGLAIGVVFVRRQLAEPRPILPVDLLLRPVLALSTAGALAAFVASMTLIVALPFRLQQHYGFGPGEVGAMIAPWPLVTMFVAPASGALSDRFPAGALGGIGMALASLALVLIALMPPGVGEFGVGWRMGLCGAGFGMFLSPNARILIGAAPRERSAAAGALISTTRLTGQTLGATLAAALLAYGLDDRASAFAAAGLAVVAGLCSVARLNPSLRRPAAHELADI